MEPSVELYPHFEASSLRFSLNNIPSLPSYQLALVQYHPSSTFYHQTVARNEWKRRRTECLAKREEGAIEKEEELRRLTRYKEKLDTDSKRMVDSSVGTDERIYNQQDFAGEQSQTREAREEVRLLKAELELERSKRVSVEAKWGSDAARHRTEMSQILSTNTSVNQPGTSHPIQPSSAISSKISNKNLSSGSDTPSNPSPAVSLPSHSPLLNQPSNNSYKANAALGPTFSLIKHGRGAAISPELQSLLTVVQVTNIPPSTTPLVILYFLRRAVKTSSTLPRPLALAKDNNRILLAFRSVDQAERAVNLLQDKTLPAVKGFGPGQKTRAALTSSRGYFFDHTQLADEVRTSWLIRGELPVVSEMEQVENLPGKQWSKEYQAEVDFIKGQTKAKESSIAHEERDPRMAAPPEDVASTSSGPEAVKATPPHLVAQQTRPIPTLTHRTSSASTGYTGPANPPPFYDPSYYFQSARDPYIAPSSTSFNFFNTAPAPYHFHPSSIPLPYTSYSTPVPPNSDTVFNPAFKRPRHS